MSETVTLNVTGMKCGGCESNIKGKLQDLAGIITIDASNKDDQVVVEFDREKISLDTIKQTINDAGFSVA